MSYLSLLPFPVPLNTRSGNSIVSSYLNNVSCFRVSPAKVWSLCYFQISLLRGNTDHTSLPHKNFPWIPVAYSIQSKFFQMKFNILYNWVLSSSVDQSPPSSLNSGQSGGGSFDHMLSASNELLCFSNELDFHGECVFFWILTCQIPPRIQIQPWMLLPPQMSF